MNGTATAVEWIYLGGKHIVTSFGGIGNCAPTEEVLMALRINKRHHPNHDLSAMQKLKAKVEEMTESCFFVRKPVIGSAIFQVEAGIHANGIAKDPYTYEPYDPELVGTERALVVGKHSGTTAIRLKLEAMDLHWPQDRLPELLKGGCPVKEKKHIVDTTLRDGEQSPGIAFSIAQKVYLARLLEEMGVHQIKAGIPALGASEQEAMIEIMQARKRVTVSAWNRLSIADIDHSMTCRPDIGFLLMLTEQLVRLGVEYIRYADTVGVLIPSRAQENVRTIMTHTGMPVDFHAHNDLGMAVANSIMAMKVGAQFVDCTLSGIGERTGNCDLGRLLMAADSLYDFGVSRRQTALAETVLNSIIGPELAARGNEHV